MGAEGMGARERNRRIVVLGLMRPPPLAGAQERPRPAKAKAAERAAMLETLQKGKEIKGGREQYRHLPGVLAVAPGAHETPQEAIARAGAGGSQPLEDKRRLGVFWSPQQKAGAVGAGRGRWGGTGAGWTSRRDIVG